MQKSFPSCFLPIIWEICVESKNIFLSRLFLQENGVLYPDLAKAQSSTCTTYGKYLWYLR